jgi:hypothetical protein
VGKTTICFGERPTRLNGSRYRAGARCEGGNAEPHGQRCRCVSFAPACRLERPSETIATARRIARSPATRRCRAVTGWRVSSRGETRSPDQRRVLGADSLIIEGSARSNELPWVPFWFAQIPRATRLPKTQFTFKFWPSSLPKAPTRAPVYGGFALVVGPALTHPFWFIGIVIRASSSTIIPDRTGGRARHQFADYRMLPSAYETAFRYGLAISP